MKLLLLTLVLVFDFALAGCHWGLYSATAQIQIVPRSLGAVPSADDSRDVFSFTAEIQIIESDDLLLRYIKNQDLNRIWAQRFKSDHGVWTDQETLDHLHKALKIEGIPNTTIVKITASSEVPQEAADIANAIADGYKAMRDDEENQRAQHGLNALREQIAQEQNALDNAKYVVSKANNDAQREAGQSVATQAQNMLDALNIRLKQSIEDSKLTESSVRILTRAVAPPE